MRLLPLLLFSIFIFSFNFFGQEIYSNRLKGAELVSSSLSTVDLRVYDPQRVSYGMAYDYNLDYYVRNKIEFGISLSKDYARLTDDYVHRITVEYNDRSNALVSKQFEINYTNNSRGYKGKDYFVIENGVYDLQLKIVSVSSYKIDALTQQEVPISTTPLDVYLDASIELKRKGVLDKTVLPSSNLVFNTSLFSSKREIIVGWQTLSGYDLYDLEWLYVDNYEYNFATGLTTEKSVQMLPYDFNKNSTRVTVSESYYSIPLFYDKGYLVFRYRGVVLNSDGSRSYESMWSSVKSDGSDASEGLLSDYPLASRFKVSSIYGMPSDKNWNYMGGYVEEGKRSSMLSYSDGVGKPRQSLVKNNSEDKLIAQGSIYDYAGRSTLTAIPSPINSNNWSYQEGLYKNELSENYGASDFDTDLNQGLASPMNTSSSLGSPNYYSSDNLNKAGFNSVLPDAEGYVFSQTTVDEQGRIRKVSGLGSDHQIGSGHETRYYYVKPRQEDLCELFGTETGLANNYNKTYVLDANGQFTVSYTDEFGRVVASGLAGKSPDNLISLGNNNQLKELDLITTSNLANENDHSYSVFEELVVLEDFEDPNSPTGFSNSGYSFDYELTANDFNYVCDLSSESSFCYSCLYDLEIKISGDDGDEVFYKKLTVSPTTTGISDGSNCSNVSFSILPDPSIPTDGTYPIYFTKLRKGGTYAVQKTLTLNTSKVEEYLTDLLSAEGCMKQYSDFEKEEILKIDTEACTFNTCSSCEIAYQDYVLALNAGTDPLVYTELGREELLDKCLKLCDLTTGASLALSIGLNNCNEELHKLAQDFMPNGQYAHYQEGYTNEVYEVLSDALSSRVDLAGTLRKESMGAVLDDGLTPNVSQETQSAVEGISVEDLREPTILNQLIEIEEHLSSLSLKGTLNSEMSIAYDQVQTKINQAESLGYTLEENQVNDEQLVREKLDDVTLLRERVRFYKYSNDPLSIFNLANILPNPTSTSDQNVKLANILGSETVLDEQGNVITIYTAISTGKLYLVIDQFKYEWALALVQAGVHPESCYYNYCIENSLSNSYDEDMAGIKTYQNAFDQGYVKPQGELTFSPPTLIGISNLDPFFYANTSNTSTLLTDLKASFQLNLEHYKLHPYQQGVYYSIFDHAVIEANDVDVYAPGFSISSLPAFGSNPCTKDLEWNYFKQAYINLKSLYFEDGRTAFAIDNDCYNGCIGKENYVGDEALFNSPDLPFLGESVLCYNLIDRAPHCQAPGYLDQEIEALLAQINELKSLIAIEKEKQNSIKEDLMALSKYKAILEKQLLDLLSKKAGIQSEILLSQVQLDDINNLLASLYLQKSELEGEIGALESGCNLELIAKLQWELDQLKKKLQGLSSGLVLNTSNQTDFEKIITESNHELEELANKYDLKQSEYQSINDLSNYISDALLSKNLEIDVVESYLPAFDKELVDLSDRIVNLNLEYDDFQTLIIQKASEIALLTEQQAAIIVQRDNYIALHQEDTSPEVQAIINDFNAVIQEMGVLIESIYSEKNQLIIQLEANRFTYTNLTSDLESRQLEKETYLSEKGELEVLITDLTADKVIIDASGEALMRELVDIKSAREAVLSKKSIATEQLGDQTTTYQASELSIEEIQSQISALEAQIAALLIACEGNANGEDLAALKEQLNIVIAKITNNEQLKGKLVFTLLGLTTELQTYNEAINTLELKIAEITNAILGLEEELTNSESTLQDLIDQLNALLAQLKNLKEQNNVGIGYKPLEDPNQLCYNSLVENPFKDIYNASDDIHKVVRRYETRVNQNPSFGTNEIIVADLVDLYGENSTEYRTEIYGSLKADYVHEFLGAYEVCLGIENETQYTAFFNNLHAELSACVEPDLTSLEPFTEAEKVNLKRCWYTELTGLFGTSNYPALSDLCNPEIMTYPFTPKSAYGVMDGSACQRILYANYEYNERNTSSTLLLGVDNPDEMLQYLYGTTLGFNFDKLKCECEDNFSGTWTPTSTWTAADESSLALLDQYVPVNLTSPITGTCYSCAELQAKISTFESTKNPGNHCLTSDVSTSCQESNDYFYNQSNYWRRLTNYLNKAFNQDHSLGYYQTKLENCRAYSLGDQTESKVSSVYATELKQVLNEIIASEKYKHNGTLVNHREAYFFNSLLYPENLTKNNPLSYEYSANGGLVDLTFQSANLDFDLSVHLTLPPTYSLSDVLWIDELEGTSLNNEKGFAGSVILKDGSRVGFTGATNLYTMLSYPGAYEAYGMDVNSIICANEPVVYTSVFDYSDCISNLILQAKTKALDAYIAYTDNIKADFRVRYASHCFNNVEETMPVKYKKMEYQMTLYYYDHANNLLKTVPPEGVHILDDNNTQLAVNYVRNNQGSELVKPAHKMISSYQYDALNRLVMKDNPDGGSTKYIYDAVTGELLLSQNEQQALENHFSYTLYDRLGRPTEVGEATPISSVSLPAIFSKSTINRTDYDHLVLANSTRNDVTRMHYDTPYPEQVIQSAFLGGQQNLVNRVSAVTYYNTINASNNLLSYQTATYYSYDDHGNVTRQVKENNNEVYNKFFADKKRKTIDYEFDLISGNVHKVIYQKGQSDQFIHRYDYDLDNRLTSVWTSKDEVSYTRDAHYLYNEMGDLARYEIGEENVQGIDYVRTLQGWLKAVNSQELTSASDVGNDGLAGNVNENFAIDAYGFNMNYFSGDYKSISNTTTSDPFIATMSGQSASYFDQFNGNIASVSNNMYFNRTDGNGATYQQKEALLMTYQYDQLYRLNNTRAYDNYATNNFDLASNVSLGATDLAMELTYDGNGNIQSLLRNGVGSGNTMDNLVYHYLDAANNNKLDFVEDTGDGVVAQGDIRSGQVAGNYDYDKLGNLTKDKSEGIKEYRWNVYGKLTDIIRYNIGDVGYDVNFATAPDVAFEYDAFGRRTTKIVKPRTAGVLSQPWQWKYTFYETDASGNVMATYTINYEDLGLKSGSLSVHEFEAQLKLNEWHIYGASRVGLEEPLSGNLKNRKFDLDVTTASSINEANHLVIPLITVNLAERSLGYKKYELVNHLGNVNVVISDRKHAVDDNHDGIVDYYTPDIIATMDYYAFGQEIRSRCSSGSSYRYGYQGSLKIDEISGAGNHYTTEFRELDPRIGKWWSLDPVTHPWQSPYCSMDNNPIWFNDPLGLWSEKRAERKAARMERKGYENVGVTETIDKEGNGTGNFGVRTTGKKDGSGSGYYFENTGSKKYKLNQNQVEFYNKFLPENKQTPTGWSVLGMFMETDYYFSEKKYKQLTSGHEAYRSWEASLPVGQRPSCQGSCTPCDGFWQGFIGFGVGGTTQATGRVFWSGGELAKDAAFQYAKSTGGVTLEMTTKGKILEKITQVTSFTLTKPLWKQASKSFAKGATGEVNFFTISAGPKATSIWLNIEKPILEKNGINIITH